MSSMTDSQMISQSWSSSSNSVLSATPKWTYEVFLTFRGEDTRKSFVSHLYDALDGAGIITFKDDEKLDRGKPIAPELLKAIEESKFAIVVFSKRYADSSWCLDELAKIMECEEQFGMKVLPVFYYVDPSDVRKQTGDYGAAFDKHEAKFPDPVVSRVQKWREALTRAASISGWDVGNTANRHEAECIKLIIGRILSEEGSYVVDDLYGIDHHLQNLEPLLNVSGENATAVRFIGIWGLGGIGKTTIAQAVYGKISYKFESRCFVEGVRENGFNSSGLQSLQEKVLSKILMNNNLKVGSLQEGIKIMSSRLKNKKILLVLDDVDDATQIEALAASPGWFCNGSRILITSRDKNLLPSSAHVYEPQLLNKSDALKMFSKHAFQQNCPPQGYKEVTEQVIRYANGLPLALKVLGSFLKDINDVEEWRSALESLAVEPQGKIHKVLKLSYDGVSYTQQQIFLDIACFFKGQNKELVTRILDSFGLKSAIAIRVLIRKSLLAVWNDRLQMHDLIQEMGWHIVRLSSNNVPKEPKEYSRLWCDKDIRSVLTSISENETIQGIMLDTEEEMDIYPDALKRMKKLVFLDVRKARFFCELTCLPKTLRWLNWNQYPFKLLPSGFQDLVGLQMLESKVQRLWDGEMKLHQLKFVRLTGSLIERFPDISVAPNLERLILQDCCHLTEVHPSVGKLKKLVFLNLRNCIDLESLPPFIGMESLETLILSGCRKLTDFPDISGNMQRLSKVYMSYTNIKELRPSIGNLLGLTLIKVSSRVTCLPSTICGLKHLKNIDLYRSNDLKKLPNNIGSMESLEYLNLKRSGIEEFPTSFRFLKNLKSFLFTAHSNLPEASKCFLLKCLSGFSSLKRLDLDHVKDLEEYFPDNLSSSLEDLNIRHGNLVRLPASICQLQRLKILVLQHCKGIEELHDLPCSIQVLVANNCYSLRKVENLSTKHGRLYKMSFQFCNQLVQHQLTNDYVIHKLLYSWLQRRVSKHQFSIFLPGAEIPDWFMQQDCGAGEDMLLVHPNWNKKIMGFAICRVSKIFHGHVTMFFKIVDNVEAETKSTSSLDKYVKPGKLHLGINYISFDFFQRIYYNLKPEDWSEIRGSIVIRIPGSMKCAVRVVYDEDVNPKIGAKEPDDLKFDYGNLKLLTNNNYSSENGRWRAQDDLQEEPYHYSINTTYVLEEEIEGMKMVKIA